MGHRMDSVLASTLQDCYVMTTDGVGLGTLEQISMDTDTGELKHLHIDLDGEETGGFHRIEEGNLLVPAHRIKSKQEYLLVKPPRT